MSMIKSCGYSHLHRFFEPKILKKTVNGISSKMKKFKKDIPFDYVCLTGISGAAIGFPVCVRMGYNPLFIRKSQDKTHSSFMIEGYVEKLKENENIKYVIIDDLIDSGKTINRIIKTMKNAFNHSECVGIFLYNHDKEILGHTPGDKVVVKSPDGNLIPITMLPINDPFFK